MNRFMLLLAVSACAVEPYYQQPDAGPTAQQVLCARIGAGFCDLMAACRPATGTDDCAAQWNYYHCDPLERETSEDIANYCASDWRYYIDKCDEVWSRNWWPSTVMMCSYVKR